MKKIILLVSILLMFALSAQAKTEEWIDKNYDFTKLKTIVVSLKMPNELYNGIREHEIYDTFYGTIAENLYEKLPKTKYRLISWERFMEAFSKENNIDLNNLPNDVNVRLEVGKKIMEYGKNNSDALLVGQVWVYDLGTSYHEGYYYTLPSQAYSTVTTNVGINATVRTDSQTLHHKPGGNYPTAYCYVRWDLSDSQTDKQVWSRLDERVRANTDPLQNTKPKDLLRRICKSMSEDLLKQLKVKD
jgi:hypothetical protein